MKMIVNMEQLIECFNPFLEENKEKDNKVIIRSAITKDATYPYWLNCLTTIKILKKDEIIIKKEKVIYENFVLLEKIISIGELKDLLDSLFLSMSIDTYDIRFGTGFRFYNQEYLYSHNTFSEWPGWYFEVGGMERIHPPNQPLVKYDTPCFRDVYDAIKEWLELGDFHGNSDARLGHVLIFLPAYKVRIKYINYNEGVLTVFIDGSQESIKGLDCQFEILCENKIIRENIILKDKETQVCIKLEDEPIETYIQLVTTNNEQLDYYRETPFYHSGNIRFIRKGLNQPVLDKISNGENDQIEFKPFINFKNNLDRKKEREIIETVISFVNTKGGSILFGVSDNSEIIGVSYDLTKGRDADSFIEDFKKYLRKLISDKTDKGVPMEFLPHKVGDKTILEVVVKEGDNKPYLDNERNLTYIRRGSTNRHPNAKELQLLFKA